MVRADAPARARRVVIGRARARTSEKGRKTASGLLVGRVRAVCALTLRVFFFDWCTQGARCARNAQLGVDLVEEKPPWARN